MLEIGQQLKVFCPGEGTYTIEIYNIERCYSYTRVRAKDYKGGYYERENDFEWIGPKDKIYYTLENNKIKHPKYSHLGTDQTEKIENSDGWNHPKEY